MLDGGSQPLRTKTVKGNRYQLDSITSFWEAYKIEEADRASRMRKELDTGIASILPANPIISNKPTKSQERWPEVVATDNQITSRVLLWRLIESEA